MAAAALSAEAQAKTMPCEIVKPWLASLQAGKFKAAMRIQENPYAKFAHLKALANSRGLNLGHALGACKKAVRSVHPQVALVCVVPPWTKTCVPVNHSFASML